MNKLSKNKTKLVHLEQAWNSNVAFNQDSKRLAQMSNDIKSFITRSMSNEQDPLQKHNLSADKVESSCDLFTTISSAFGFQHHEGTDPKAELKVIKVVLVREGLLMSLRYLTDKARKNESIDKSCSSILELLAQIRESTLNYLEALCLWRQTAQETEVPRMFFWERKNYTMKIVTDLDFLSENIVIVTTLGIPESQFRSNPLMLTNNLEDMNTWMDPQERAVFDCNGKTDGAQFESRLRLRFAERILLQEVELANAEIESSNASLSDSSQQMFITQQANTQQGHQGQEYQHNIQYTSYDHQYNQQNYNPYEQEMLQKGSSILEDDYEDERFANPDGYHELSSQKSSWDNNPAAAALTDIPRARSADSGSSMQHPQFLDRSAPDSRSSAISYGFSSAPSSSHASRGGNRLLMAVSNPPPTVSTSFEFGHDFFSGNWGDGQSKRTPVNNYLDVNDSTDFQQNGDSDIYFIDGQNSSGGGGGNMQNGYNNYYVDETPNQLQSNEVNRNVSPQRFNDGSGSVHSVDPFPLSPQEIAYVANIQAPPRELVLAGSVCIILLSSSSKVPVNLAWSAFQHMANLIDVSAVMHGLESIKVAKFKLVALLPFLQMLTSDSNIERVQKNRLTYPEYQAVSRFIEWVKQFTTSALNKVPKLKDTSPNRKPLISTTGHRLPAPSKVVLNPIKVNTKRDKNVLKSGGGSSGSKETTVSFKKGIIPTTGKPAKSTSVEAISPTLKNSKNIPKVTLELAPFYNEMVSGKHRNDLLLVLLTTPALATQFKNSGNEPLIVSPEERLVVKVLDIVERREAVLTVNIREYTLVLKEIQDKCDFDVVSYFAPCDLRWWAKHVGELVVVQLSSNIKSGPGSLKLSISRKGIEDIATATRSAGGVNNDNQVENTTAVDKDITSEPSIVVKQAGITVPKQLNRAKSEGVNALIKVSKTAVDVKTSKASSMAKEPVVAATRKKSMEVKPVVKPINETKGASFKSKPNADAVVSKEVDQSSINSQSNPIVAKVVGIDESTVSQKDDIAPLATGEISLNTPLQSEVANVAAELQNVTVSNSEDDDIVGNHSDEVVMTPVGISSAFSEPQTDDTYGEEAFEEDRTPSAVGAKEVVPETADADDYAADFERQSVVETAAVAETTSDSNYAADFEENSFVVDSTTADELVNVRHSLSEFVAESVIHAAEQDLQSNPNLIHQHSEPHVDGRIMSSQPLDKEENTELISDDYEGESFVVEEDLTSQIESQNLPHQSIIELVQQEFDDYDAEAVAIEEDV